MLHVVLFIFKRSVDVALIQDLLQRRIKLISRPKFLKLLLYELDTFMASSGGQEIPLLADNVSKISTTKFDELMRQNRRHEIGSIVP